MSNKTSDKNVANDSVIAHKFAVMQQQINEKDKRIQELEEYISIAPNLDEMTATKFINIQREAYIRGKAEEQQRAEQIIYENYIPKQAVIDKIKEVRSKRIKHEIDNKLLLDGVREKYLNNKGKFDSCELVTYCIHNEYLGEEHYLQELLEGER